MRFSQRMGIVPVTKIFQVDHIDDELRNRLWNMAEKYFLNQMIKKSFGKDSNEDIFYVKLWEGFLKKTTDSIPAIYSYARGQLKIYFFEFTWYMVYDFIEYIALLKSSIAQFDVKAYRLECNEILQEENSAYRFVGSTIAPITNPSEISEIEEAIFVSGNFTSLQGANIHLHSALSKLSDKQNPDYRNSIKESISAVESVAKKISGKDKKSLGPALQNLKSKTKIHSALEQGFNQIYGYTSDGDGIRHALMDEPNCDFEDAKFMLVSCSAFINYLIVKADKAGIPLS